MRIGAGIVSGLGKPLVLMGLLAIGSLSVGSGGAAVAAPLVDAAMNGDIAAVRTLLRQRSDTGAAQPDGMTALHWAVHREDAEMTTLLLRAGADVNAVNRIGATPLYLASAAGSDAMLDALLRAGANPNVPITEEGETALMFAARTGNVEAVRVLLDHGAVVDQAQQHGQTALMWAAAEGHPGAIGLLLERGADPNASSTPPERQERRPPGGMTALLFAARQGHLDAVKALLDGGADLDRTRGNGTTPLVIALINGHYAVARELLERGADPNIADDGGRAALYSAIDLRNAMWAQHSAPELPQREHMAMIRQILAAGADVNAAIVEKIPHRGSFDMRWTDFVGGTPFLLAAWHGDVEVMRLLLEHGADPHAMTTEKDENALLLLAGAGWPLGQGYLRTAEEVRAALELLVEELGMDVNSTTNEGVTPVMLAAYKGTTGVLRYLVDNGARLDAVDDEDRTVLMWSQGVVVTLAQPPRLQPETEALIRELMEREGLTARL